MYDQHAACRAIIKHLPSLEVLLRLENQCKKYVSARQEERSLDTKDWLTEEEIGRITDQVATCLRSPTGVDLAWLMLPHLINVLRHPHSVAAGRLMSTKLPPVTALEQLNTQINGYVEAVQKNRFPT